MSGKSIAVLVGVAAAGGGIIWWLRSRDKKAGADAVALLQAAQTAQQAVMSAVPQAVPASGGASGLTAAQVAEMNAHPEARRGAGHFNGAPAEELYANTGAGHF